MMVNPITTENPFYEEYEYFICEWDRLKNRRVAVSRSLCRKRQRCTSGISVSPVLAPLNSTLKS